MSNFIEFNRSNWDQVVEFTGGLAKGLIIERCIDGLAYCSIATKKGYQQVKEGQFIYKESESEFSVMNPPPGFDSGFKQKSYSQIKTTKEFHDDLTSLVNQQQSRITQLEDAMLKIRDRYIKNTITYNIITKALNKEE